MAQPPEEGAEILTLPILESRSMSLFPSNKPFPITCSFSDGLVVPIPTLTDAESYKVVHADPEIKKFTLSPCLLKVIKSLEPSENSKNVKPPAAN